MIRRRIRHNEDDSAEINITPLLDIVFIMLIFFIVTASFVKESGIEVNRPNAQTVVTQESAVIFIAIDANDEIWIDRRIVDLRAVRANVERLRLENPQGTVVIQADKRSSNGALVGIMDQVRLAGVERIAIAATEK